MTKRKSKKVQPEEASVLFRSSVPQSKKGINSSVYPAFLSIIIFLLGASIMGWFCMQQQSSFNQLSESFVTMQKKVSDLQLVMEMTDPQFNAGFAVEERIFALEEAQKQAQERAEFALATSQKLKNSDLHSKYLALRDEINIELAEMKQVSLYVANLQATFKNQSQEFEAVKKSVNAGLSSGSALTLDVAKMTSAVANALSRVDAQALSVETLHAHFEGQTSHLNELKDLLHVHKDALHANNQKMAAIKDLVEAEQTMRDQALKEMLSSVQMTLDEQFSSSQSLHNSIMSHLQTFHTQLASSSSWSQKVDEKSSVEDFISAIVENAIDEQTLEKVEEEAKYEERAEEEMLEEQEVGVGTAEEQDEAEITEKEEKVTPEEQEEVSLEVEEELTPKEADTIKPEEAITPEDAEELTPEEGEKITSEEEEQEEILGANVEAVESGKTKEEEVIEESVGSYVLDSSKEDVSEKGVKGVVTVEEDLAE